MSLPLLQPARRRRRNPPLATMLFVLLHVAGVISTTLLLTWGLFAFAFIVIGGFSFDGLMHQLANLASRYVAATPDRLASFRMDGRDVARMKERTRLGERLSPGKTGVIPGGCYYVGTAHKDGFDSRYAEIGLVCQRQIIGVGTPVL